MSRMKSRPGVAGVESGIGGSRWFASASRRGAANRWASGLREAITPIHRSFRIRSSRTPAPRLVESSESPSENLMANGKLVGATTPMRAAVLTGYGGVDRLELREVARPEPGPGQLLVRV